MRAKKRASLIAESDAMVAATKAFYFPSDPNDPPPTPRPPESPMTPAGPDFPLFSSREEEQHKLNMEWIREVEAYFRDNPNA